MALLTCWGYATYGQHEGQAQAMTEEEFKTFTVDGVTFKMIFVKGGTFTMGATEEQGDDAWDNEKPIHNVTLDDYYIGETEVTQALWRAVMHRGNEGYFRGKNRPMEQISWDYCMEFLERISFFTGQEFRLPTEAEWEFAARGGNKSKGYKYSGSNTLDDVAWYDKSGGKKTHDVAQKQPNELGLYDMSGNVAEWCQDWAGPYGNDDQTNPTGPSRGTQRSIRGGGCWSWYSGYCRVSARDSNLPDFRYAAGLRIVLSKNHSGGR